MPSEVGSVGFFCFFLSSLLGVYYANSWPGTTSYTHTYSVYTHTQSMDKHIPYEPSDKTRLKVQEIIRCLLSLTHTPQVNLEPVVPPDGARITTGIMTAPGSWADLSRSFSVKTKHTFGLDVRKYSV